MYLVESQERLNNWTDDFGRRFGDLSDGITGRFRTWSEDFGRRFNDLTGGVGSRFNSWKDDLEMRLGQLSDGFEDTSKGVGGVVGGAWGLFAQRYSFLRRALYQSPSSIL